MKWTDCVYVQRRNSLEANYMLSGVRCTELEGIDADGAGFSGGGQITVRIPGGKRPTLSCGDRIQRAGSKCWYTVTAIRDNNVAGSNLSHWRVVGRR